MLSLYASNRLDILLTPLAALLNNPTTYPLEQDILVVQSVAISRWLNREIAEKTGIAANLDYLLTGEWLWEMARRCLDPNIKESSVPKSFLSWYFLTYFEENREALAPQLQAYLDRSHTQDSAWLLSTQLADAFDHYLNHRPEWILAWEAGKTLNLGEEEAWQAQLWQALTQDKTLQHRARLYHHLLTRLNTAEKGSLEGVLPERMILFGFSYLPPFFIQLLNALGQHTEIAVFLLNPCEQEWSLALTEQTKKNQIARYLIRNPAGLADDLALDDNPPLLASFGRLSRDFFSLLNEGELPPYIPCFIDANTTHFLGCLQQDLLTYAKQGTHARKAGLTAPDTSIVVHSHYSMMREVEGLYAFLLNGLQEDPTLKVGDIVVMMPDLQAYAPFIHAVFKEAVPFLPYQVVGQSFKQDYPILNTLFTLLNLSKSRFGAQEVMGWLECPALLNRFELDSESLETFRYWVESAAIFWGYHGQHRTTFGLAASEEGTWTHGFKRLMLGVALPPKEDRAAFPLLFQNTLPCDGIEGLEIELLGHFIDLMDTLYQWSETLKTPRTVAEWRTTLTHFHEALFVTQTEEDQLGLGLFEKQLQRLLEESQSTDYAGKVSIEVVQRWLESAFEREKPRLGRDADMLQFSGMVTLRCLPFKRVCLLGMNEGEFPRQIVPNAFDLLNKHPVKGDIRPEWMDRALLLEALLSAQDQLFISYIGQDIRSGHEHAPAVPVSELLQALSVPEQPISDEQWIQKQPLHPFDPRYFQSDLAGMGTRSARWLAAAKALTDPLKQPIPPIFNPEEALNPLPNARVAPQTLKTLSYFFSNPSRAYLQAQHIYLQQSDDPLPNTEPFELSYDARQNWARDYLTRTEHKRPHAIEESLEWAQASGFFPLGQYGQCLAEDQADLLKKGQYFFEKITKKEARLPVLPYQLTFKTGCLEGIIDHRYPEGLVHIHFSKVSIKLFFTQWLEHLMVCALQPADQQRTTFLLDLKESELHQFSAVPPDAAKAQLACYHAAYCAGQTTPLPFFIKSAWKGVTMNNQKCDFSIERAESTWLDSFSGFAESQDPYHALLWRGYTAFEAWEKHAEAFLYLLKQHYTKIDLHAVKGEH